MDTMLELKAFVNSLTYGSEPEPMTVEDAAYTMEQWREEALMDDIPEDLTPELFAALWNSAI